MARANSNAHAKRRQPRSEYLGHPTGAVVISYQLTADNERTWEPYRAFAERRLLAIRRGLEPFGYRDFLVTIDGPPPDACFVVRNGQYRLTAGVAKWHQATAQDVERSPKPLSTR